MLTEMTTMTLESASDDQDAVCSTADWRHARTHTHVYRIIFDFKNVA